MKTTGLLFTYQQHRGSKLRYLLYTILLTISANAFCADSDGDGIDDLVDNCPSQSNAGQADHDGDGIGTACDTDDDNDGLTDAEEQSLGTNQLIADTDSDGLDDGYEVLTLGTDPLLIDTDGDGISDYDEVQNGTPPTIHNSQDTDGDQIPDIDDPDDDNDGVDDINDAFPFDNSEHSDNDNDGTGDNADSNDDNDSFADALDPFPFDASLPSLITDGPYIFSGTSQDERFGWGVALPGDLNGDGYADIVVGAPVASNQGNNNNETVYAFSGLDSSLLYTIQNGVADEEYGRFVSAAGDVNADGYADFIVGAERSDVSVPDGGAAYIYSGLDGALLYSFYGDIIGTKFGIEADTAGDINNDGHDDVIINAYQTGSSNPDKYVKVFSGQDGSELLHLVDFGRSVSSFYDFNNDTYSDLLVSDGDTLYIISGLDGATLDSATVANGIGRVSDCGSLNQDNEPDIVVSHGSSGGAIEVLSGTDLSTIYTITPSGTTYGFYAECAGDVDGDGTDDIVSRNNLGLTVFSGTDTSELLSITDEAYGSAHVWMTTGQDINNDGRDDILIGSPNDDGEIFESGLAYIITLQIDSDNDGMADWFEQRYGLNPLVFDSNIDSDNDGLSNLDEYVANTNPLQIDTDNDGMNDAWEVGFGLNPLLDDSADDLDGDGLSNADENNLFLNPASTDTDIDGLNDYEELHSYFTDPILPDTDRDGLPDGWEVLNGFDPLLARYLIGAGKNHSCIVDESGLFCWGLNDLQQIDVPALGDVWEVAGGRGHTCSLGDDGVVCWGDNNFGQRNVPGLTNPRKLAAGDDFNCALDDNGITCWGDNSNGQLNVPALTNPQDIQTGWRHACALDKLGSETFDVVCWGDNSDNQLNRPSLNKPRKIAANAHHSCAVDDDSLKCWGKNDKNQNQVPPGLGKVKQLGLGRGFSCAVDDSGLQCWGDNTNNITLPPNTIGMPNNIRAGGFHICVFSEEWELVCWGKNDNGQATPPPWITFDADNDGMTNDYELTYGFDLLDASDATSDADNDGISNLGEQALGTNPTAADSDGDAINDQQDAFPTVKAKPAFIYEGKYVLRGNSPGDRFGISLAATGDIDGDSYNDFIVGSSSNYAKVISGKTAKTLHSFTYGWEVDGGYDVDGDNTNDYLAGQKLISGASLGILRDYGGITTNTRFAGDVNNDGYDDILAADWLLDAPSGQEGAVWIYSGKDNSLLYEFYGSNIGDRLGYNIFPLDDINQDNHADFAFRPQYGDITVISGIDGSVLQTISNDTVSNAGDINNDGYTDLFVRDSSAHGQRGSVYIYSGFDSSLIHEFIGNRYQDSFGQVVNAGDYNDDGYDDILIGASREESKDFDPLWPDNSLMSYGTARIYSGKTGEVLHYFEGQQTFEGMGYRVANLGDIDGDGKDDLAAGCVGDDLGQHGTVYVLTQLIDSDDDNMSDAFESLYGLDLLNPDAATDSDNDGLSNIMEFVLGTQADNTDSDGDGTPDGNDAAPNDNLTSKYSVDSSYRGSRIKQSSQQAGN